MMNGNDIEQLFKAHFVPMHRLAMALLHDEDLARDIVHDVFVSLLDGRSAIVASLGYLLMAVRNRCLNHIRACQLHERVARLFFAENGEYDADEWPDEETISRIYSIIESEISPQARRVIELRFAAGLPFAKVAETMGISQTAVFRHLRNAISIIRKKINQHG
ncbi:MAG: sigma-70 family RNA polymerase sigma factor [Muribaculaceae bacterium]|nr:sigma-70 family RNA polymerase sigma factor [Muribaculaceae bacterium]